MTEPRLVDALAECLDRIEDGMPVDEALADFPEVRDELAPLLAAALRVRGLPTWTADNSFRRKTLRELSRLEDDRLTAAAPIWLRLPGVETLMSGLTRVSGAGRNGLLLRGSIAAIAIALVLGAIIVPVLADDHSGSVVDVFRGVLVRISDGLASTDPQPTDPANGKHVGGDPASSDVARSTATVVDRMSGATTSTTMSALSEMTARPSATPTTAASLDPPTGVITPTPLVSAVAFSTPTNLPPTATSAPSSEPRPADTDRPPETDQPAPSPQPSITAPPPSPMSTASPSPTAVATQTPRPGSVSISGWVKHDDETPGGRPLPGADVLLFRTADVDCTGPEPIVGTPLVQTSTVADGAFTFTVPPGEYLLAAEGGPECLTRLWHIGPSDPGVDDPCSAFVLALLDDGQSFAFANILYDESLGCPLLDRDE